MVFFTQNRYQIVFLYFSVFALVSSICFFLLNVNHSAHREIKGYLSKSLLYNIINIILIFTDARINVRFMNVLYIARAYIETSSALNIKSYKRTSGPLGRIIKFQN